MNITNNCVNIYELMSIFILLSDCKYNVNITLYGNKLL